MKGEPSLAAVLAEIKLLRHDLKASLAKLLTVDEAAQALALSPKTVRNQMSLGKFPIQAVRAAGGVRFRKSDIDCYVDSLAADA